jgi:hypothetical protein
MRLLVVAFLLLLGRSAAANPAPSYDLAGLVLKSDAIVVADRVGPRPPGASGIAMTRYRVVRVLRAARAVPAVVDIVDFGYQFGAVDTRVWLFLAWRDGELRLVPSGIRTTANDRVFRFWQPDDPGGYASFEQPDELTGAGHLDSKGFERALVAACQRVDALLVSAVIRDPMLRRAAILATVVPNAAPQGLSFIDAFEEAAITILTSAGDREGVRLVRER